jgi:hypothetical protein
MIKYSVTILAQVIAQLFPGLLLACHGLALAFHTMPPKKGPPARGSIAQEMEELEEVDIVDEGLYPPDIAEFRMLPLWLAVQRVAAGLLPSSLCNGSGRAQSKAAAVAAGSAEAPADSAAGRPHLRPRARTPNMARSKAAPATAAAAAVPPPTAAAAAVAADDDNDDADDYDEPVAKRRNT